MTLTATVAIAISVSHVMEPGRWTWVRLPNLFGPDIKEYVYNEAELLRAFTAYGAITEIIMRRRSAANRFRLVAGSLHTGRILGEYQWVWSAERGVYTPAAEPMVLWPAPWELPDEVLRGAELHFVQDPYSRAAAWADAARV